MLYNFRHVSSNRDLFKHVRLSAFSTVCLMFIFLNLEWVPVFLRSNLNYFLISEFHWFSFLHTHSLRGPFTTVDLDTQKCSYRTNDFWPPHSTYSYGSFLTHKMLSGHYFCPIITFSKTIKGQSMEPFLTPMKLNHPPLQSLIQQILTHMAGNTTNTVVSFTVFTF